MQLKIAFDKELSAWTLTHHECNIDTLADIDTWKTQLQHEFTKVTIRPSYLLIDLQGFNLSASMAEHYGNVVKTLTYAGLWLGVVRYDAGRKDLTATVMRLQAIKNKFPSNIFPNREAALEALAHIRQLPESPAPAH